LDLHIKIFVPRARQSPRDKNCRLIRELLLKRNEKALVARGGSASRNLPILKNQEKGYLMKKIGGVLLAIGLFFVCNVSTGKAGEGRIAKRSAVKTIRYEIRNGRVYLKGINCRVDVFPSGECMVTLVTGETLKLVSPKGTEARVLFSQNGILQQISRDCWQAVRKGACEISIIPNYWDWNHEAKITVAVISP
jgi:hypothetical protein